MGEKDNVLELLFSGKIHCRILSIVYAGATVVCNNPMPLVLDYVATYELNIGNCYFISREITAGGYKRSQPLRMSRQEWS